MGHNQLLCAEVRETAHLYAASNVSLSYCLHAKRHSLRWAALRNLGMECREAAWAV